MSLIEIYRGRETWANYLKVHQIPEPSDADFDVLTGDIGWRAQLSQETIDSLLDEVRLPEFEREARAYRIRAERAYLNGWYQEALADFLEAAQRNYPDYSVHRSIACLYLYHIIDLPKALEFFGKAAKYSRPSDPQHCAEAHYFAGIVCALERKLDDAMSNFAEAVRINPKLSEAHYRRASLAAFAGDETTALTSLEEAIKGEARFFDRARKDESFEPLRLQVESLLEDLIRPIRKRVAEVRNSIDALQGFVISTRVKERLSTIFRDIDERMSTDFNYATGMQVLEMTREAETELDSIPQRFNRHYQIDPRDYIRSLAFSHDSQWLVVGLLNGGMQLWEANSGLQVYSVRTHLASVTSVTFSPDDLWIASASRDRMIKLWEAPGGQEVQSLSGHKGEVRSVVFSPDGQWLASGGQDRVIRLWRLATGHEAETLHGHTGSISAVVFSPNGRLIASGGWDRTIRLWEVATGREAMTFEAHANGVAALAVSPNGEFLASGGEDGEVKLWNLPSGRQVRLLTGHRNSVTSLAFSPDGNLLACGSLGRSIVVWRVTSGDVAKRIRYPRISYNSVAFSPHGQWLAFGSRSLELWLKALLTRSEFDAVRDGEARALEERRRIQGLTSYTSASRLSITRHMA